jgi:hypothetical protein
MARLRLTHNADGTSRLSVIDLVCGTEVEEPLDGVLSVDPSTNPFDTAPDRRHGIAPCFSLGIQQVAGTTRDTVKNEQIRLTKPLRAMAEGVSWRSKHHGR